MGRNLRFIVYSFSDSVQFCYNRTEVQFQVTLTTCRVKWSENEQGASLTCYKMVHVAQRNAQTLSSHSTLNSNKNCEVTTFDQQEVYEVSSKLRAMWNEVSLDQSKVAVPATATGTRHDVPAPTLRPAWRSC